MQEIVNSSTKPYAIKLVRLDRFRKELFTSIDEEAEQVIAEAPQGSILALTLTTASPSIKVIKAEIFNEDFFDKILSG